MSYGYVRSSWNGFILVITTSLRTESNSDRLSEELIRGAKAAGHEVGHISLKGKEIKYCIGCLLAVF